LVASQALVIALGASFNGRRLMLAFELDPYEIALSNLSFFASSPPQALRAVPEQGRLCVGSGAGIVRSSLARPRRLARLLNALALEMLAVAASAGDSQIRDQVLSRLNAQLWRPSLLNMTDYDGNVDLWGFVTSNDEKKAALPWKE
jgi:hypothetical protein